MQFKMFSQMVNGYIADKEKETRMNWDAKIKSYKKWFITAVMIAFFVFLVIGWWSAVLITYLIGHFHVMINENYQKIRTLEKYVEENA